MCRCNPRKGVGMTQDIHVIPINDLREHDATKECWCKPIEDVECNNVWIHNSMDGREKFETGERLLS